MSKRYQSCTVHVYMTDAQRTEMRDVALMLGSDTMSQAAKRCVKIVAGLLKCEEGGRYIALVDPKRKKLQRVLMV